ncbi:hypothetical protein [Phyllobacterium sp. SB3]|uniref:hypothetical protein n=1 Tax=Phyllobacterium sp. SB3 TaxID=3156073 RepID=UPI0032AED41C
MSYSTQTMALPQFLQDRLIDFTGHEGTQAVLGLMRSADEVMSVANLSCIKASRLSFADMLVARMVRERWSIRLISSECRDDGAGRFVYRIEAGGHAFSYIARAYPWDGKEKVGRRSDGALRDLFGALFVGLADDARINREFETFDMRDVDAMRTDSDVIGWTPANRSSRHFDATVDALVQGKQPDFDENIQYLLRNGGFQSSGRNGSISYLGIPAGHPLCHPFFADLFAIYLVRIVSIDLVNAVARNRNPHAVQLDSRLARHLGVGNSSGQGMCVALQRWPHWVSTWVTQRELALAYAKSQAVTNEARVTLKKNLAEVIASYEGIESTGEELMTPSERVASELQSVLDWLDQPSKGHWVDFADKVAVAMDGETREQFNSILVDLVPDFCDAIAPYFILGTQRQRVLKPEMSVATLRSILRRNYSSALRSDRTLASSHQHFWYHSVDHGEQRRGDRIVDPSEEYESFIDHFGLIQRLASVLASYTDQTLAGEVILRHPDLHFAISRVQYLDGLPYAEIRDCLATSDFLPSNLIRFFLASLGIRSATPLSMRYVRGTFFQGVPLPEDLLAGGHIEHGAPAKYKEAVL